MKNCLKGFTKKLLLRSWLMDEEGAALTETVILFPVLISLMMGVYDLGNGIVVSQKTIAASQITADLITREISVTSEGIDQAIIAGMLAIEPFNTDSYGIDIAAVRFDENGMPEVYWRKTQNMAPNEQAVTDSQGLGEEGDGVIVVTVQYIFRPFFSEFVVDQILLQEVAYLHGRRSSMIECTDCV